MNKYKLIVLCGKSGAGKDYLLKKICEKKENKNKINLLTSDTTRPKRDYEIDGIDYNFLTPEEFSKKEHLEWAVFNNWYYGTPYNALRKDRINVAILNPSGVNQLYTRNINKQDLEIIVFFIHAEPKIRLIRQMEREKNPDYTEICRRFLTDEEDFKILIGPLVVLNNNTQEETEESLEAIQSAIEELNDSGRMD